VTTGELEPMLVPVVETVHWGFSIQYSTYYLPSPFTGGLPKKEPMNQFVPLVEFKIDCLRASIKNPEFAYVAFK
jgi:hypothetical protein